LLFLSGCADEAYDKKENTTAVKIAQENQEVSCNDISTKNINYSDVEFIEPSSGSPKDKAIRIQKVFPINIKDHASPVPFHSDSDEMRYKELKSALDGNKKYIWCSRGGYGSARLFENLKSLNLSKSSKVIIGYSDITFLHLFFNKIGIKTIHGAMPVDVLRPNVNCNNFSMLKEILNKKKGSVSYDNLTPLNQKARCAKSINGELIGGNLTLITNSLGTEWQINGDNKIILIEDTHAKGYAIDRDLNHIKQSGILKNTKCILFGTFSDSDNNANIAIKRFAESVNIPVFVSDKFGHGTNNYPLPFGFSSNIIKKQDNNFEISVEYNFY
jgi:muramoyltetrapeptide carboxypeptidase